MTSLNQLFDTDFAVLISFAAIVVMLYCLLQVVSLKPQIPGGIIGKYWNVLMGLVLLFTVGYVAAPFFNAFSEQALRLIVAFIFFFGALYVLLTVRLMYRVITELSE